MMVRKAHPEDNDALMALASACPMNGDLSLCVDRYPDFFALNRLAGGGQWQVGVIDGDNDGDNGPIACIAVARREVYLHGEPASLAYVGDLKVHPAHRRRGAARALLGWAIDTGRDLIGADGPLMCTVLGGNTAVDTLRDIFTPEVRKRATIRSHSISLLWRRRLPRTSLTVRLAEPADTAAMTNLWQRLAPGRQFAPLHHQVQSAGLDYLLAHHRDGELAGFLGLWDQHAIKQMRVTGYSRRLGMARKAFNLASPLFRVPRMPAPGGEMSYRTVVSPCALDPQTLRALLLHACHRLHGECSLLTIGLDTRDPLTRALSGLLAQPTDVDVLVLGGPSKDDGGPVHFEIAMV